MTEEILWQDYVTIGVYFAVVLAVGIWSTFRPNKGSATGYFLAGKTMHWIPIGASIYASNIGSPMYIGLAGSAAASGFSVTIYEWHAIYLLIALGWVFVPVYIACGAYTMPEYLKKRYGGKRIRIYASVLALIEYILTNISGVTTTFCNLFSMTVLYVPTMAIFPGEIYAGAIFMQLVLGWNLYFSIAAILAVTAVYTIAGGLASVIYTDTLQTVILIAGAIVVTVLSLINVGGWSGMVIRYPLAAANYTLDNQSFYQCGMPRDDAFHIFRSPTTGDVPWPGAVFGLTTLGLFTWCQDQIMVQRSLSAKNMMHVKAGSLLAAFLKLFGFLLFIVPGMISRILYPDDVACAHPAACKRVCGNEAGCSSLAYPLLLLRILPAGIRGLMLAAFLAAMMSTLTSIFNSASSIVTLDIWPNIRKKAKETELMIVGRVSVLLLIGVSILWLPVLQQAQGGILWFYLQSVRSYLVVPWCMVFLFGFFWKRTTEQGAFWGLMVGLVVGLIRMGLDYSRSAPICGSGEPDRRWDIVAKVDFLHFAIILTFISSVAIVLISLFTQPRSEHQLHRVTWWTKNALLDPELTDDEEEEETDSNVFVQEPQFSMDESTYEQKESNKINETTDILSDKKQLLRNWLCGTVESKSKHLTPDEKAAVRRKMTSLEENEFWSKILNISAVMLSVGTAFLFGFFA